MKKLDVIAPINSKLVTILQDVNCATGSIAINDEFHDMFISINGELKGPFGGGRYSLDPGFSPFFARMRTYPTGGKAPINVTVFYVSKKNYTLQWGTGEITCSEKVLNIPLPIRLAAGGTLIFRVKDSKYFLKSLVGLQGFDVDDLDRSTRALVIPEIRDAIVARMTAESFIGAQANLSSISENALGSLLPALESFGLTVTKFVITCFNIRDEDLRRLQEIHEKRVTKATDIEALSNEINTIYNGNAYDRARVEALINFSKNQGSGSMAQIAMFPALWTMGGRLGEEMQGLFGGSGSRTPQAATQTCAHCHRSFDSNFTYCPHCGQRIN